MGQAVRVTMTASPLHVRAKLEPWDRFRASHLLWPVAVCSQAGGDQGRSTQSAVIGCLIDVLGLAQSFGAEGQNVEQSFISGAVAVLSRNRAFRLVLTSFYHLAPRI